MRKITNDERMEAYLEEASEETLQRFVDLASFTLRRMKRMREKETEDAPKTQAKLPGVE